MLHYLILDVGRSFLQNMVFLLHELEMKYDILSFPCTCFSHYWQNNPGTNECTSTVSSNNTDTHLEFEILLSIKNCCIRFTIVEFPELRLRSTHYRLFSILRIKG